MNLSDIKSDVNFLCGTTSGTYPDADKVRNLNLHYQRIATLIWQSDGTWNYDDNNNSDTPIAYRTIANASASYLMPTSVLRVRQVEIKDANSDWQVLTPITYEEMGVSPEEYMTGGGTPAKYLLDGTQIRLFPTPQTGYVTMTSGLAVRLSRAPTEFAVTATTTTPGFPSAFHRILSLSTALDFVRDNQDRVFLLEQKDRLEKGLVRFFSGRSDDHPSVLKPKNSNPSRTYV